MGIKKDMKSIKDDITAIKDKWNTGSSEENALMVAAVDSALLAAKADLKARALVAKTDLKVRALLPKSVVYSSKAVLRRAKRIREIQARQALISAAAGCELGILPEKERRSPRIQAHSKVPPNLSSKYKINSLEENAVAVRSRIRKIHRSGVEAGEANTNKVKEKKPERKGVSPVSGTDTSGIESRNGIKQRGNDKGKETAFNESRTEEKNGIHARGKKDAYRKEEREKHISERKELHGSDKIKDIEKKNGIKSEKGKENRKKKESKKENKKKGNSAARQEMKYFVMNQITGSGGDEKCSSGFGEMGAGILKSKVKNNLQDAAVSFSKAVGKGLWKILLMILKLGLSLLKWLLLLLLDLLVTIIAASLPILLAGALIIAFFGKIGGFFGIFSKGDEFVVDRIKARAAAVAEEINKADEVRYHAYDGSCDIYMNQDDMLLIYISKMADLDDLENDDAFDESEAPYFIVNKRKEKKTIDEVMGDMLYFRRGAYEKEVTVTVTPAPSATDTPAPSAADTPVPQPVLTPIPTPVPAGSAAVPVPAATPEPSGVPSVTPVPETTTVKVIVHTLDVYMRTAEDYLAEHGLKKNQKEVYDVLAEVFTNMGYSPGGGSTICDSY